MTNSLRDVHDRRLLPFGAAFCLACLLSGGPVLAGAFNQQAGKGQVIVTTNFSTAGDNFGPTGKFVPASNLGKFEATALLEYGFTDWLMGIVKPSVLDLHSSGPPSTTYSGLGATEIGLQARVLQFESSVVAVQATLRVPGASNSGNPLVAGMNRTEEDLRVLFGHGFEVGGWQSFVDLQAGYRWRGGGPPDEMRIDATIGTRPVSWLMFMLQSFNTISQSSNSLVFPSVRQHKLQASVVYDFSKSWSVQLGAFANVAGRNIAAERGALLAAWYRF